MTMQHNDIEALKREVRARARENKRAMDEVIKLRPDKPILSLWEGVRALQYALPPIKMTETMDEVVQLGLDKPILSFWEAVRALQRALHHIKNTDTIGQCCCDGGCFYCSQSGCPEGCNFIRN
jgi:hypothetical protein